MEPPHVLMAHPHRQQFQQELRPRPDLEGDPPASPQRCINLRPQPGQQQAGNGALIQLKKKKKPKPPRHRLFFLAALSSSCSSGCSKRRAASPRMGTGRKERQHQTRGCCSRRGEQSTNPAAAKPSVLRCISPARPATIAGDFPMLCRAGEPGQPGGSTAARSQCCPPCQITPSLLPRLLGHREIQMQLRGGGSDGGKVSFAVVRCPPGTRFTARTWVGGRRAR